MKRFTKVILFVLGVAPSLWGADMTLDFSKEHTLKGVFDAGVRPYRESPSGRFQVAVENINAQVKLPSGAIIEPRLWKLMTFSVISDGRLTNTEMRSHPLTLSEAKAAMVPLLNIGGGSIVTLDAFLQKVGEKPFFYEGDFHIGTGDRQNPMFLAAFSRTGFKDKPLALRVSLDWHIEPKSAARAFYKEPIPPPPGYENVSMEKPPYSGSTVRTVPTPATVAVTSPSSTPRLSATATPVASAEKPSPSGFPIVLLVILAAVIAGTAAFLLRRKSP